MAKVETFAYERAIRGMLWLKFPNGLISPTASVSANAASEHSVAIYPHFSRKSRNYIAKVFGVDIATIGESSITAGIEGKNPADVKKAIDGYHKECVGGIGVGSNPESQVGRTQNEKEAGGAIETEGGLGFAHYIKDDQSIG